MRTQLIILFILVSGVSYAQSVTESDSIRLHREKNEQILNNYNLSSGQHALDHNSSSTTIHHKTEYSFDETAKVSDMNLHVPKYYEGPLYDNIARSSHNPFADDYSYYGRNKVMQAGWINTSSSHTTYVGLGSLTVIRANYEYMLSDDIIASVGAYGARYFYNSMVPNYDFGINASLRYQITDQWALIAFGQYSARSKINEVGGDNAWMMPNTNYGGVVEFKINDKFGIQGGIKRELNPMSGKWITTPIFSPVIRLR